MKRTFSMLIVIVLFGCSNNKNSRNFNFVYSVELEPSNGKKIELWIPLPKSNEVQTIADLNISTDGLQYEVKDEKKHGNKYLYVFDLSGTTKAKKVSVSFNVARDEIGKVKFSNVETMLKR